jgi:NADH dehydrogenase FAD-containing subunit
MILIEGKPRRKKVFNYKTKWMMASIGKRNGVIKIGGTRISSMRDMAYVLSG